MLTNNKKNFVRSIAMLLVLLMVVAMGLTACGNKDAVTKEEVETTVADKLTAALGDYIKKDDTAAVQAIVEQVLGDNGLTAESVATLKASLADYVKKSELETAIADVVLENPNYVTKAELTAALKDLITAEKVEEIVDEKMKNYFGEFTPEQVQKMMTDLDKAMNLDDWNEASELVIATIADMQDLLTAVDTLTYTQENMKKVNAALEEVGIAAPFTKASAAATKLSKPATMAEYGKLLEYRILRVATLDEIEELKATVAVALAVPTFESELKALENALYALGENVKYGSYTTTSGVESFTATKWPNVDGTYKYHNIEFAKNTNKLTQVVTLNDKDGFYAWNKKFDALYTTYYLDGCMSGSTVYDIYRKDTTDPVTNVVTKTLMFQTAGATAPTDTAWRKVGQTIINDNDYQRKVLGLDNMPADAVLAIPTSVLTGAELDATVATTTVVTDYKTTGKYGYAAAPATISDVAATGNELNAAYSSIVAQLNNCQAKVNAANTTFDNFQLNTIYNSTEAQATGVFGAIGATTRVEYDKVTDSQLVAALTPSMCEAGGVVYTPYLTDVTTAMEISVVVNGKTTVGINEYPLYEQMVDKAYDLLWAKYKLQAQELAATMLKDYMSLVYEAKNNTVSTSGAAGSGATVTLTASATDVLAGYMNADQYDIQGSDLTTGFVAAYLNGTADGKLAGTFYETIGKNFNDTKLADYYTNNGAAYKHTTATGDAAPSANSTWQANPLKSLKTDSATIPIRLTAAMLITSEQIEKLDKDAMKASDVTVDKAFNKVLADAFANLDEIIARYLIEDYKAMTYNDMVVKAADIFAYYGANADALNAMEKYLVGVDSNKKFGFDYNYTTGTTKTITSYAASKNAVDASLTNNQLVNNLSGIKINPNSLNTSNGATEKIAAAAMAQIDDAAAKATAVVENAAIKVNFVAYITDALYNLNNVYNKYAALVDGQDYILGSRMIKERLVNDDALSVLKYNAELDGIALMDYKENYLHVLAMIVKSDNKHLALLTGKTIEEVMADNNGAQTLAAEQYAEMLKAVKSTYTLVSDANKVESWKTGYAVKTLASYDYVGTAVVALDKLLNEQTQITTTYTNGTAATHRYLYE